MSITRHHNEWLSLVPNSGPFLSLPVLAQAFPQGLDAHDPEHARRLRLAFDEWDDDQLGKRPDPGIHRAWIKFVLAETLGYDELLAEGQAIPQSLKSDVAEYGETLRPDWIVNDPATQKPRVLVQTYPRTQSLTKPVAASRWKTSPDTRMMQLLHDTGIRLGIVTNGDHWMLVNAPKNETTGYANWYASLWLDEPLTQRAFRTMLGADRMFSVPEGETLEALLDKSASDQQEVTDQLGYQVRKAVEVLIQALDKADQDHGRTLLAGVDEKVLYESALTVMMRLVFLFCAEERDLLLLGDELYDKNYSVSTLREQLRTAADQHGEEILGLRHDAWARLLTTFRAVYAGVKHDRLKLPAYGGSLFNPDRFPFLEGRKLGTSWKDAEATPLPVSNRTVLHLLEALQVLQTKVGKTIEARKLSFRSLDIEQIGHVYEGLLDHTAKRATEPMLGLAGTRDKEPEVALAELGRLAAKGEKDLLKFLKEETGRSESALKKALAADIDDLLAARFRTACQDGDLWDRVKPFAGLVRLDTVGYPLVILPGSLFVTAGTDRRSSGTHYTPKSLTEPIVQYTLEPLVYVGPAEGLPKDQWQLKSPRELLDLKICDMACGSGAFLVQVCRYMSARLMEAWDAVQRANPGTVRITPDGEPSTGQPGELLIPDDPDERQTYALRTVAQRCVYGVDKNPLAVEMAKLSLWLLTLAKDKPFEFLDHAIRCGDSLVGIHNADQLRKFNLDGRGDDNRLFLLFLDKQIKEAIDFRVQITEMQANTVDDVAAQDGLLREANEKIDRLKCAADYLISAEFTAGSMVEKRAARDYAATQVAVHFHDSDLATFRREADGALGGQVTFHWPLEFPEALVEHGGFDAIVGNPPFLGGKRISTAFGDLYERYLKTAFAESKGAADLCCYFFRQGFSLLGTPCGYLGLLATNSIVEGDSRDVALGAIQLRGGQIYRARPDFEWPGTAGVRASQVHIATTSSSIPRYVDDVLVPQISSYLDELGQDTPYVLHRRLAPQSTGQYLNGSGFIITAAQRQEMLEAAARNASVIWPYLNGELFNDAPKREPPLWAVNFGTMDVHEAKSFAEPFAWLTSAVKPNRDKLTRQVHESRFWLYWDKRESFLNDVKSKDRVLVCPIVTKYLSFRFYPPSWVFSHGLKLFDTQSMSTFAILQSSINECWARKHSSSLEQRLRYSTSDSFDTFPMPKVPVPETIGNDLYNYREAQLMQCGCGLTTLYNSVHDSHQTSTHIQKLRELHVKLDQAVGAAYGWSDLDLGHGYHIGQQGVRFSISEHARREVLRRLLALNHEQYALEVKQGLHSKQGRATKRGSGKGTGASRSTKEPTLFHSEDDG